MSQFSKCTGETLLIAYRISCLPDDQWKMAIAVLPDPEPVAEILRRVYSNKKLWDRLTLQAEQGIVCVLDWNPEGKSDDRGYGKKR